jgi:hypothetical protein
MRLDFLCTYHRRALLENPLAAQAHWLDCRCRLVRSQAPTPYTVRLAGAALEAAEIYLLSFAAVVDRNQLQCYSDTGLQLIDMLVSLRQARLAQVVLAGVSARIWRIGGCGESAGDVRAEFERLASRRVGLRKPRLLSQGRTRRLTNK